VKAFDTCVLARAIVGDDPHQSPIAVRQLEIGGFVSLTVILELAWVLKSNFGYGRALLADTLDDLCHHPGLVIASDARIRWAAGRLREGADIGDLIHLAASEGLESFVTFDDMTKKVGSDCPIPVEVLH
jgi:predicted nucleic-acid-binding protein